MLIRIKFIQRTMSEIVLSNIFQILILSSSFALSKSEPQESAKRHQIRLSSIYNTETKLDSGIGQIQRDNFDHSVYNVIGVQNQELKVITLNGTYKNPNKNNSSKIPKKKGKREKKKVKNENPISVSSNQEPQLVSSSTISKNVVDVEDQSERLNLSSKAPYENLPDTYKVQPTSYYATHTHVEPIKDFFAQQEVIDEAVRKFELARQQQQQQKQQKQQQQQQQQLQQLLKLQHTKNKTEEKESEGSAEDEEIDDKKFEKDIETGNDDDDDEEDSNDDNLSEETILQVLDLDKGNSRSTKEVKNDQETKFTVKIVEELPKPIALNETPKDYEDSLPEEFNPIFEYESSNKQDQFVNPNHPQIKPSSVKEVNSGVNHHIFNNNIASPPISQVKENFNDPYEPTPEFETDFIPSKQAPQFIQSAPTAPTFNQQPRFLASAHSSSSEKDFGVSVTPIVVNQDGFKEGNLPDSASSRIDKSISGIFDQKQATSRPDNPKQTSSGPLNSNQITNGPPDLKFITPFNPKQIPTGPIHPQQISTGSVDPQQIQNKQVPIGQINSKLVPPNTPKQQPGAQDLKPVASGSSYSNQWTVSGDKKPTLDPSFEAAKYWQRVKEQGFFPKHVKPPAPLKDQQAVESLDEFSEFDHQFVNFPTFQTEPPMITYDPNIVYEREQVAPYVPAPTTYEHLPTVTYVPEKTVTYYHDPDDGPEKNALLFLSPKGPKIPVFSKLTGDLSSMLGSITEGFKEPLYAVRETAVHSGEPMLERMGHTIGKMMGGHFGDGTFDAFDFIPLVAVVVGAGLLLAGLFPNGLTSLGLTNGNVVLGRKESRRGDDAKTSMLDEAIDQLETGILMVSAMRRDDGCDARLACRLGGLARESALFSQADNRKMILGAINQILPETFHRFSRSFEGVVSESDLSSCEKECYRCVTI